MITKFTRWVATVVLTTVVVVMVGVLLLPLAVGLSPYVVTSGSMRPTFEPGAVVLTDDVAPEALRTGDIVTFRTPDDVTTHRVVGMSTVTKGGADRVVLTTQGDANNTADTEPLDGRNVLGEVRFAVPWVGYLVEFVKTALGIGVLLALFAVILFTGSRPPTAATKPSAAEDARTAP